MEGGFQKELLYHFTCFIWFSINTASRSKGTRFIPVKGREGRFDSASCRNEGALEVNREEMQ